MNTKSKSFKKAAVATVCVIAVLWAMACVALYRVMRQSPESFARVMAKIPGPVPFLLLPFESLWTHARGGSLQIGDRAPDFSLVKLDKSSQIRISDFTAQQRPVVLVFGSYT